VELRPGNVESHPSVPGRHDPPAHLPTGTKSKELLSFFLLFLDFAPELKLMYLRFLFEQDGKTLDFLYYFDYLRAYPHVYNEMTKPYGPPGGK